MIMQQSYKKKLINFDAKKHYIKVRSRYDNASLINLLKKNNRHYTFIIKTNVTNTKIIISINKHYPNIKNFENFKKDRHK